MWTVAIHISDAVAAVARARRRLAGDFHTFAGDGVKYVTKCVAGTNVAKYRYPVGVHPGILPQIGTDAILHA